MIGVITNPNSKKNRRNPGRADQLRRALGDAGIVRQTPDVLAIPDVLHEFEERGVTIWVSDGGDGALHWMLNHGREVLLARGAHPDRLRMRPVVPTNGGTIDFVAKKAGIVGRAPRILASLAKSLSDGTEPPSVLLDSLWVAGETGEGAAFGRLGFACAVAGVGQRFFEKYYAYPRPGAPTILKVMGRVIAGVVADAPVLRRILPVAESVRAYGRSLFEPVRARVSIDGVEVDCVAYTAIHAGSIDVDLGGVIRVFPMAHDAGNLHFQAGAPSPMRLIAALPDLYRGRSPRMPRFTDGLGQNMDVQAAPGELLDPVIDGELTFGLTRVHIGRGPVVPIVIPE